MLNAEETFLLPRSVLSVSANRFYCTANWNIVESKDTLVAKSTTHMLCLSFAL